MRAKVVISCIFSSILAANYLVCADENMLDIQVGEAL